MAQQQFPPTEVTHNHSLGNVGVNGNDIGDQQVLQHHSNGNDIFHGHPGLHPPPGYISDSAHALSQMREPFGSDQLILSSKHPLELSVSGGFLPSGSMGELSMSPEGSPDRKRRRVNGEQEQKRLKYDVLKSFFRLYFKLDNQSMVLKDAIFNLYLRKIPAHSQIARNAMYRRMWSYFGQDKIGVFQSNYREYVKGIKLITTQAEQPGYDGYDKDFNALQEVGAGHLWDFQEEELAKNSTEPPPQPLAPPLPMLPAHMHPSHSPDFMKGGDSSEDELINSVANIEATVHGLLSEVRIIKAKILARRGKK